MKEKGWGGGVGKKNQSVFKKMVLRKRRFGN